MSRWFPLPLAWLLVFAALVGCARVDIRKVPARSTYSQWCDEDQRRADSICGQRYYLPRPFLSVSTPFAVAGGDFYVSGRVTGQGQLISMETARLPAALRPHFPSTGPTSFLPVTELRAPTPAGFRPSAAAGATPGGAAASEAGQSDAKPLARLLPDLLKEAAIQPEDIKAPAVSFGVTVKLAKEKAGAIDAAAVPGPTPCLIPLGADGAPRPDLFIRLAVSEVPPASAPWSATADATYKATAMVANMTKGKLYLPGLLFKGRIKDETATDVWHLVYRDKPIVNVTNAPAATSSTTNESQKEEEPAKTVATFKGGQDPTTNPVIRVDERFQIVMLQDFEEQYAVQVDGGLGIASAKLGLENGWMLENSEYQVNNQEVGKFVFHQLEKFVDLGLKVAESELLPSATSSTEAADALSKAGEEVGNAPNVMLHIRYVLEAQPGVYPILKPWEAINRRNVQNQLSRLGGSDCGCGMEGDTGWVYIPCPPYTVVAKDVRRRVVVQLVNVVPKGGNGGVTGTSKELLEALGDLPQKGKITGAQPTGSGALTVTLASDATTAEVTAVKEAVERLVERAGGLKLGNTTITDKTKVKGRATEA